MKAWQIALVAGVSILAWVGLFSFFAAVDVPDNDVPPSGYASWDRTAIPTTVRRVPNTTTATETLSIRPTVTPAPATVPPSPVAPAPTAPPPTLPPPLISVDGTIAQQNALEMAASYLEYSAFSRSGLVGQLEYEGFSTADATWAVDRVGANWNEQAAKMAASYLEYSSFSRSGLIDQLLYEGFTPEQAEYGVNQTGL